MRKSRLLAVCVAVVAALAVAAPVLADDFSNGSGANAATNWKTYTINSSGNSYSSNTATGTSGGVGFAFQSMPDTNATGTGTSLLMTTHPGDLLGDLTGKRITATFTINAANPVFTYYGDGQSWNPCGSPAAVRLYFEGNTNGAFNYSKYWWSNPSSDTLASAVGNTITLTVPLDTADWSNWDGQLASDVPAAFNAAVADVTGIVVIGSKDRLTPLKAFGLSAPNQTDKN